MMHRGKCLAALAAIIIILASPAIAGEIIVRTGESIQSAIDLADPGEAILVQGGVFRECLNISKPLTLVGISRPQIDAGAMGSAVLINAAGVNVTGFDIRTVRRTGIYIRADDNIVLNNSISGCLDGIRLEHSKGNRIISNGINNNTNGMFLYSSDRNIIAFNSIRDNNIDEQSDCGIALAYSRDNLIQYNDLKDNGDSSLSLRSSGNNSLRENRISFNDWYGISLSESSNYNLIEGNSVFQNKNSGIYLDSSRENIVRDNMAKDNSRGIYLSYDSNENLIKDNNLSSNDKGLHLANHSSNNTIENNTARENGYGIFLSFSCGWNLLFSNHLIGNGQNACDLGQTNRWDNGSIGNYYSDLGRIFYVPGGSGVDSHPMAEPAT